MYNVIFDPGKDNKNLIINNDEDSFTENIVLSLIVNIGNRGRILFFNSWYSSISLIHKPTNKGFRVVTTLRKNAKNLPNKEDLENSSKHYAFSNENNCFIKLYKDKKDVYFASNFKENIEDIKDYYNEKNRGVDIMDHYISYYNIERRSIKWWKKIFFFGIEVCINNSYILSKLNNDNNSR